ncbi:Retrovirus-related Pol polyprotein from transposon TNT 1-94 [Araneus ventricosus]|uniref:Retrovirus-related Pol polyprotein from transposon TNT 1-94 n=1 Tax=Araneus ventricosus TaxID=182803 RepID=A0A4Y2TYG7_ARAVE|nr:Retrovirus-related Pol polyprotein from transposon TNT 1-94 [Araneus ventricosus]
MEIDYRQDGTIFLHSESYIKRILKRFNLDGANTYTIPADPGTILSSDSNPLPEGTTIPYRETIGSLMFLAITTRPDIAFAVNVVSRFQSNPGQVHWNAVKRIFRYPKDTADIQSQKQSTVSTSTTETEYIAASIAVKEVSWLRQLLQDVSEGELCDEGITLFVDNQSAIKLIKNPVFHKRTKHIDVRYHFIGEKCDDGSVNIKYVKYEEQLADIFTKALPKVKFEKLRELLNIKEMNHLCDS